MQLSLDPRDRGRPEAFPLASVKSPATPPRPSPLNRASQQWSLLRPFHAPAAALLVLLQRSPAPRVASAAGAWVLDGPAGAVLKAAAASLAALGAVDSVAGASTSGLPASSFTYSLSTGTPGHPSPYTVTQGAPITQVAFALQSSPAQQPPQAWAIEGPMPPGISFGLPGNSAAGLGAGQVAGLNLTNPTLYGTPTEGGDYKMLLQAYQLQNGFTGTGYFSTIFTYEIIVDAAPAITAQPSGQSVPAGGTATFSVTASGYPAPTYQWDLNGSPIAGATGASLTVTGATPASTGNYTCVVTNPLGSATSSAAALSIAAAATPAFTAQPTGQTIAAGATVVFTAAASGSPSPTYQWRLDGSPVAGATGPTLVVHGAAAANAGSYTCVATNPLGTATSSAAVLAVSATPDAGRLVNISCRAEVGTGGNILIAGFVSGGPGTSGTQPVLIRGSGPALAGFGVAGTLADPALSLYQGPALVAANAGWGGGAQITAIDTAVGAFGLSDPSSKDSALYLPSLAPNSYTAQVAGAGGDTGVALAEVYDATPAGTYAPSKPRIVNISARVQVGTGGSILIAGFVIGGSTSKTVLIRASGPALAAFGVAGVLPDPQLTLLHGSTVLATNGGWAGDGEIAATAASVGAFAWSDPASKDSALLVTLPPGAYTAQVSGAAGTAGDTGVSLVEVYDVP